MNRRAILGVLMAGLITLGLYSLNTPPFSLVKKGTESVPASTEAPTPSTDAKPGQDTVPQLVTMILDPLDAPLKGSEKSWVKTVNLVNQSNRPITVHLFLNGASACGTDLTENCFEFDPEVELEKNSVLPVSMAFKGDVSLLEKPVSGKLYIVGGGIQEEHSLSLQIEKPETWQGSLSKSWEAFLGAPASSLMLLLLFILVGYVLYQILYWKVFPYLNPKAYNILKMEIGEDAETKKLWTLFSGRVREMQELGDNLVNPQPIGAEIELPANIGKEGEILRTILDLLSWILPRKELTMRLQSLTSPRMGRGLSVSLVRGENKEVIAERVFWASDYSLDDQLVDVDQILMIPVVIWMAHSYKKYLGKSFKVYGVSGDDWESVAYGLVAVELWRLDPARAHNLYMEALFHDSNNRLAQNGLGRIWIENSQDDEAKAPEKRERLELAIAYLVNVCRAPVDRVDEYTIRLAAMYNLASAYLLLRQRNKALRECETVLSESRSLLADARLANRPDLQRWVHRCITLTILLKYGVLLEQKPPGNVHDLEELIQATLGELREMIGVPSNDDALAQNRLLISLNYRTQYNAACFFSQCYRLAKDFSGQDAEQKATEYSELALDYLRLALGHGGTLAEYAHKDKSLEPLRVDFKPSFNQIAKKKEAKAAESPKATPPSTTHLVLDHPEKDQIDLLPGMTDESVQAFHALSIHTWSDLLLNGIDPDSRRALHEKTKVEPEQITWWLNLCDLTRIPGLSLESAILLEGVGRVDTVKELSSRNAEALSKALGKRISAPRLSEWIDSAKSLIPALEYKN